MVKSYLNITVVAEALGAWAGASPVTVPAPQLLRLRFRNTAGHNNPAVASFTVGEKNSVYVRDMK
jgi:hypothetical protein